MIQTGREILTDQDCQWEVYCGKRASNQRHLQRWLTEKHAVQTRPGNIPIHIPSRHAWVNSLSVQCHITTNKVASNPWAQQYNPPRETNWITQQNTSVYFLNMSKGIVQLLNCKCSKWFVPEVQLINRKIPIIIICVDKYIAQNNISKTVTIALRRTNKIRASQVSIQIDRNSNIRTIVHKGNVHPLRHTIGDQVHQSCGPGARSCMHTMPSVPWQLEGTWPTTPIVSVSFAFVKLRRTIANFNCLLPGEENIGPGCSVEIHFLLLL